MMLDITLTSHFCPQCGELLRPPGRYKAFWGVRYPVCPDCGCAAMLRGSMLFVAGALVWFFGQIILTPMAPVAGTLFGVPLMALGVLRMIRRSLICWRHRRAGAHRL